MGSFKGIENYRPLFKAFVVFQLLVFFASVKAQEESEFENLSHRKSKFLMSVSVPPVPCGEGDQGVCLPRKRCARSQGTPLGGVTCAQGFGECCSFSAQCNATTPTVDISQYVTTLKSPSPANSQCTYRIRRQTNVCQVSVEFVSFMTPSANFDGICVDDSLSIRGSVTVPDGFTTCGTLTGQKIYLSYGGVSDTIELRPAFKSMMPSEYRILVTQIPCSSSMRVPDHCFQYYNSSSGSIKSLDYGGQQQSRQRYTVCVGGTNSGNINYRRCTQGNAMTDAFFIQNPNPTGALTTCDRDWIQINGRDRMCSFPTGMQGVNSDFSPFLLNVNFDDKEIQAFPWGDAVQQANDMASCTAIQTQYPNLISACQFFDDVTPGVCQCDATPAARDLIGFPDSGNTGFCLEYTQT